MELIDQILSQSNLKEAIKRVKANKGAAGVDKRTIYEIDDYFKKHQVEIKQSIRAMKYKPQAVRRVYIPKANGKKRPFRNSNCSRQSNPASYISSFNEDL